MSLGNCGYQKVPLKSTDLYECVNIKRNHYKNAVIAFQKIFSPIVLHMIHYIFAFLSHNLGPNSQSGDKHPVIELSILELSTGFYYKIYTRISLLNVTSRLPIFEKFHPAQNKKNALNVYWFHYKTFNILTKHNEDFSHGHFEL